MTRLFALAPIGSVVFPTMGRGVLIHPVFLFPDHPATSPTRNLCFAWAALPMPTVNRRSSSPTVPWIRRACPR